MLKADLQSTKEGHKKELEIVIREKDHLSSVNQSLQNECQSQQAEIKEQREELNVLKADLQNTQDGPKEELELLISEKDHLSFVNQSLQNECQSQTAELKEQRAELNVLNADLPTGSATCRARVSSLRLTAD